MLNNGFDSIHINPFAVSHGIFNGKMVSGWMIFDDPIVFREVEGEPEEKCHLVCLIAWWETLSQVLVKHDPYTERDSLSLLSSSR